MKAKPDRTRKLTGAARQVKNPVPVTMIDAVPPSPYYFNAAQTKVWKETCEKLIRMQLLTEEWLTAVECHVLLTIKVHEVATGKVKMSPASQVTAIEALRRSASELGLSPASHAKVEAPKAAPVTQSDKVMEELIA